MKDTIPAVVGAGLKRGVCVAQQPAPTGRRRRRARLARFV